MDVKCKALSKNKSDASKLQRMIIYSECASERVCYAWDLGRHHAFSCSHTLLDVWTCCLLDKVIPILAIHWFVIQPPSNMPYEFKRYPLQLHSHFYFESMLACLALTWRFCEPLQCRFNWCQQSLLLRRTKVIYSKASLKSLSLSWVDLVHGQILCHLQKQHP